MNTIQSILSNYVRLNELHNINAPSLIIDNELKIINTKMEKFIQELKLNKQICLNNEIDLIKNTSPCYVCKNFNQTNEDEVAETKFETFDEKELCTNYCSKHHPVLEFAIKQRCIDGCVDFDKDDSFDLNEEIKKAKSKWDNFDLNDFIDFFIKQLEMYKGKFING